MFHLFQIQQKIPAPQGRSLADCGRLCGLQVSESEAREIPIPNRKLRQLINHLNQTTTNDLQTFPDLNQLRIIRHKTTGCPKMYDRSRGGTLVTPRVHMSHHIVSQLLLVSFGDCKIDGVNGRTHF